MNYEELAAQIVAEARRAGADEADVYLQAATDFSVEIRKGQVEKLTQAGSKAMGLRVFKDKRTGFASTSDFTPEALRQLIARALALAEVADRREESGLPDADPAPPLPDLRLYDPQIAATSTEQKIAMARACEEAAFRTDPRITNSEGAGFGSGTTYTVLANSNGFIGSYRSSGCSVYCQPLAEEEGKKQVDYEWAFARSLSNLESPEEVGQRAAQRVLRKLGARKVPTQNAPVVFERRVAARLWAQVAAALDGDRVYKGMSFLKDRLGEQIATPKVTLIDDGTLPGGVGSAPFDGDGLPTRRNVLIEAGVLRTFLYDTETARKVGGGVRSTHNARRSPGSVPGIGTFNLFLAPGQLSPEEIIQQISRGFFVTDLMGTGANLVTGDYSTGASGLWIENGELAYPVEEVTIASTVLHMLQSIERVGTDLAFQTSVASPTFQVAEMTISGL